LTAGDFLRTAKQLIDLLRQMGQMAPDAETARTARSAADAVHRDLVAASSVIDIDGEEASDAEDQDDDRQG